MGAITQLSGRVGRNRALVRLEANQRAIDGPGAAGYGVAPATEVRNVTPGVPMPVMSS